MTELSPVLRVICGPPDVRLLICLQVRDLLPYRNTFGLSTQHVQKTVPLSNISTDTFNLKFYNNFKFHLLPLFSIFRLIIMLDDFFFSFSLYCLVSFCKRIRTGPRFVQ